MAEGAAAILLKRDVWSVRLEARQAEETAKSACASSPAFICKNETVCGFGDCVFATDENARISAPAEPGESRRPQELLMPLHPTYRRESIMPVLLEQRGLKRP